MSAKLIRVLLVDDHAIARNGIRAMLELAPDICVHGQAETAADAVAQVRTEQFDVAVVDISLPDQSGVELITKFREKRPVLPVIVLSSHPEEMYGVRTMRLGAAAYLTKNVSAEMLQAAVHRVACGGKFFSASMLERLAHASCGTSAAASAPHEGLSCREFEIMKRIAAGQSLTMIGGALFISPKTVSTHRTRILEKMGFNCNAQLTRYAIEQNLM